MSLDDTSIWHSSGAEILQINSDTRGISDRTIITVTPDEEEQIQLNGPLTARLNSTLRLYTVCLVMRLSLYDASFANTHKQLKLLIKGLFTR